MAGCQRRAIVVIARVARHNKRIALSGQRTHHIAEGHVRKPGRAVVSGLARPHPVTGPGRVAFAATGALAPIIPSGKHSASGANRNIRLPLRTRRGIAIQFEWRAKGYATICGTNVKDVTSVAASAVLRVNQVNNTVEGSRFTPTLMSPEATLIGKHAAEVRVVAASLHARSRKRSAGVCVAPAIAAIRGPENLIRITVRKITSAFIHARDVDGSVARCIAGDLHIANKGTGIAHIYRRVPRCAIVSGKGDLESATANAKVVP